MRSSDWFWTVRTVKHAAASLYSVGCCPLNVHTVVLLLHKLISSVSAEASCCLNLSRVLHLFSIVGLYFQLKQHLLIDSKQKKRIKIDAEVSRPFFFFVKTLKPVVYVNQSVLLVQMQGVL